MQNGLCLFPMLCVAAIAACQNSVPSVETALVVDIQCPMSRFMHYAEVQACFVERALELTLQMQICRNQLTRCRFGLKKGVLRIIQTQIHSMIWDAGNGKESKISGP